VTITRWEYHIEVWVKEDSLPWSWGGHLLEGLSQSEGLTMLGKDGWELVAVTPYNENGQTCLYDFHFKRPI
jgi:hypothetical protein